MAFLTDKCRLISFPENLTTPELFDCGHSDLNDFFARDCHKYTAELMGKTYCFVLDANPSVIVCAFSISNDSIKTNYLPNKIKNKLNRKIPYTKRTRSYPAVLIGRLGVNKKYQDKNIGTELMDFIKSWFIDKKNKTGCRYIVVDSYNEPKPIGYYSKNGFSFLFDKIEDEISFFELPANTILNTRLMIFDLILLRE